MSRYLQGRNPDKNSNIKEAVVEWIMQRADALMVHSLEPAVGSIVYCNLALAVEHSGIYVGNDRIVHLNGSGRIELVSPRVFCERLHGKNPASIIYCPISDDGRLLGNKNAAERALNQVGRYTNYNVFMNNCHKFTASCVTGKHEICNSFKCLEELIEAQYGEYHWRATDLTK